MTRQIIACFGLCGMLVCASAAAQPMAAGRDPVAAELLFRDGKTLAETEDWASACPKFEASQALDPSPSTLIWIGRCHRSFGRVASAWYAFQSALKLNLELTGDDLRRLSLARTAESEAATVFDRLPSITIVVAPVVEGLVVTRTGAAVPLEALGQALPVDPGSIIIRAEAPGFLPAVFTGEIAEGESREVRLELRAAPALVEAPPARPSVAAQEASIQSNAPPALLAGWSLLGVAIGTAGASSSLGVAAWIQVGRSNPECSAQNLCSQRGVELRESARLLETAAWILGGVGAASGVVGVVLIATSERAPAPVSVRATVGVAGVHVEAGFE